MLFEKGVSSGAGKDRYRFIHYAVYLIIVLILVLGLFYISQKQKEAAITESTIAENPNFEVNPILIKLVIKEEDSAARQLSITNTGESSDEISISYAGLGELLQISEKRFSLDVKQTKTIELKFDAVSADKTIKYNPDIYVGKLIVKSNSYEKEVPVIIEVESKNVLFDMNLNMPPEEREIQQGSTGLVEARLFNLKNAEPTSIDLEYSLRDLNGNSIIEEKETISVSTQLSVYKTIDIPKNIKAGNYVYASKAVYGSSVGTSSYLLNVVEQKKEASRRFEVFNLCGKDNLCWISLVFIILVILAAVAYIYFVFGAWIYKKTKGISIMPSKKLLGKVILEEEEKKLKEEEEEIKRLGEIRKKKDIIEKQKIEIKKPVLPELQRLPKIKPSKEDIEKERRRKELHEFNEMIREVEEDIKNKNIRDAFYSYAKLKSKYNKIVEKQIGEGGKEILYKKMNKMYRGLCRIRDNVKKEHEKEAVIKPERKRFFDIFKKKGMEEKPAKIPRMPKLDLSKLPEPPRTIELSKIPDTKIDEKLNKIPEFKLPEKERKGLFSIFKKKKTDRIAKLPPLPELPKIPEMPKFNLPKTSKKR